MKKVFRCLQLVVLIFFCLIFSCCATAPASVVERGSAWLSGSGAPRSSVGEEGDYYLDFNTSSVYEKTADGWALRGALRQQEESPQQVKITFDANLGTLPPGYSSEVTVAKGESFALPVPVREGYSFLGWFYGEGANGGQASDLTVFARDVLLTAKWRKLHVLTLTAEQSVLKLGEAAFRFSGNYDGTEAATFTLFLEKDGVRKPVEGEKEWLAQSSFEFTAKSGSFRGVLLFAEEGEYRLIVSVEEADEASQAIVAVTVTE